MSVPRVAKRMQQIAPFRVMEILARAQSMQRNGVDVVHMEVGEPDFPAPRQAVAAAQQALDRGQTHYTPAAGLPQLREALAAYYRRRFNLHIDPGRILVTPGASGSLQLALGVLVEPGDQVLIQDPGYPCNRHMIGMFGGQAVAIGGSAAGDSGTGLPRSLAPHLAEAAGVMLATPANPTGEVIAPAVLADVYRSINPQRQFLLVDEIYQGLQYGSQLNTALALGESGLFVINSFSKYFGMTGFRVGWMVAPEAYVEPLERLAQNLFLAPPTLAQHAALAVLDASVEADLEVRRAIFERRRNLLFDGLGSLGFELPPQAPGGAFYVYAGVGELAASGDRLAAELLQHAGVAITPGSDFGGQGTERHVRFAYTTDESRIEAGLERMRRFFAAGA